MKKSLLLALLAAALASNPAFAAGKKKEAKKKVETGASCKAPAVGRCATCSVTCPPGETATCSSGQMAGDVCHKQPACGCTK